MKYTYSVILLFFFWVHYSTSSAQDTRIDSLKTLFSQASGTVEIDYCLKLVDAYQRTNLNEAMAYAHQALKKAEALENKTYIAKAYKAIADTYQAMHKVKQAIEACLESIKLYEELKDKNGLASAYNSLGNIYQAQNFFPKALKAYAKSLEILRKLKKKDKIANVQHNMGVMHYYLSNYDQAISLHEESLKIRRALNDDFGISNSLFNLGIVWNNKGSYKKAEEYIFASLAIQEKIGDQIAMAKILNSIGVLHSEHQNFEKALEYYHKALSTYETSNNKMGIGIVLNNIAIVHVDEGRYDQSMDFHKRSLVVRESINDKRGIAQSYSNIGEVYYKQGDLKSALEYQKKGLKIRKEIGSRGGMGGSNRHLGTVYMAMGNYDAAEHHFQEGIAISKELNKISGGLSKSYKALSEVYEIKGDYKKALTAYKNYTIVKDSVYNEEETHRLAELTTKYETEKKEQQLSLLNKQAELDQLWRNLLIGGIMLLGLIAFFIYRFQRIKAIKNRQLYQTERALTRQLQEVDRMKSRFFTNISHEFRTPLTLILGPVEELLAQNEKSQQITPLQLIKRNAHRLLKLINQLLELSKIEAGKISLQATPSNIIPFLKGIALSFESLAEQRSINFSFKSREEEVIVFYEAEKTEQILINLISNALKFTPPNGRVEIIVNKNMQEQRHYLDLVVRDTGVGIHTAQLPHIFDRFYQADNSDSKEFEGTGIGLSLTKELVELHGGTIEVKSTKGEGTEFLVRLPQGRAHLSDDQIVFFKSSSTPLQKFNQEPVSDQEEKVFTKAENSSLQVLIVEDNLDLRTYISSKLQNNYQITLAKDGQEGWEIAQKLIPDLIISDVMMPKMNGMDLCRKIKRDEKTSHIPLILLTAKIDEEEKLRGLALQADDYLTKPFNAKELGLRVRNLINSRKKLQKRFANKVIIKPKDIATSSQEEKFLEKLIKIMEQQAFEEDFSVEDLGQALAMSRSQIQRKLKAITNQTPNQFIRRYRLERAKQLLEQNAIPIADIAFEVGFSSAAYFSKCFQDEFGYSPSTFKQQKSAS